MPDTSITERGKDAGPARRNGPRPINANTPLLLSGPNHRVHVVQGAVDVFAVRLEEGAPSGPRHSVFRAVTGDIVLGLPTDIGDMDGGGTDGGGTDGGGTDGGGTDGGGADGEGEIALILVGGLDARVYEENDGARASIDVEPDALDRLVVGLMGGFDDVRLSGAPRALDVGETSAIAAGAPVLSAGPPVLWVEETEGRAFRLLGAPDARAACLPATPAAWVSLAEDGRVKTYSTADILARGDWRATVRAFLGAYARLLADRLDRQRIEERRRIDAMTEAEAAALDASLQAMGATFGSRAPHDESVRAGGDALAIVFRMVMEALRVPAPAALPVATGDDGERVDAMAHAFGVRTRRVLLREGWWRVDGGPMIGFLAESGTPTALLPRPGGGYLHLSPDQRLARKVSATVAAGLAPEAIAPYKPLPSGASSLSGLVGFVLPALRGDFRRIAAVGALGGALAAITPMLTGHLIEDVLPRAALGQHVQVVLALTLIAFGAGAFEIVKVVALMRIEGRADHMLQAALFDRLLRLPTKFYRRFTTGDLTDRVLGIQTIRQTVTGTTLASLLGLLFSVFSLIVLFHYNWRLALVAIAVVLAASAPIAWMGRRQLREERARMALQGKAEGFVLQMVSAIGKLRTAGAERRAFAQWGVRYAAQKRRYVAAQRVANDQALLQSVLPVLAAAAIFSMAAVLLEDATRDQQLYGLLGARDDPVIEPMTTGEFVAFNTAFGQFLLAMTTLVTALTRVLAVIPMFERLRPILEEPTEDGAADHAHPRRAVGRLDGGIEINQVSFRYGRSAKPVLDGLSLSIAPKEFVAIVGPSGSGKSTLVRLLLGFETPESGDILFDGAPLHGLELASVRRQVQVVLQDARLSGGSLYSNISGGRRLEEEAVWRAVRQAGLEPDVEALPMGLHTVVTEGVNTFSGGQRQRLLIARALAQEPSILVMDEPTSALDNKTQDLVMNTLANVNATRIVIAHRISTVRHVDRILVMDAGRIVESGGFDDLIERGGLFSEIANRQHL